MITILPPPVFSHFSNHVEILCYGNIFDYKTDDPEPQEALQVIEAIVQDTDAHSVVWQRLANKKKPHGRWSVLPRSMHPYPKHRIGVVGQMRGDGARLDERGDCIAFTTRDCPTLILWSVRGGPIAVLHCGRDALHGIDVRKPEQSIIREGWLASFEQWTNRELIRGVITMGIAPENFANDRYPELVESLVRLWGVQTNPNRAQGTLDLVEIILKQLEAQGVSRKQIIHDGLDTYSNPLLASLRAGRGGHNLVVVTYTSRT